VGSGCVRAAIGNEFKCVIVKNLSLERVMRFIGLWNFCTFITKIVDYTAKKVLEITGLNSVLQSKACHIYNFINNEMEGACDMRRS
jgi:hypothetical protein